MPSSILVFGQICQTSSTRGCLLLQKPARKQGRNGHVDFYVLAYARASARSKKNHLPTQVVLCLVKVVTDRLRHSRKSRYRITVIGVGPPGCFVPGAVLVPDDLNGKYKLGAAEAAA